MDSDAPQATRLAPSPFDQPSADLILRTADLIDFRVHTQILSQASSFFATMLALPQPTATSPSSPAHVSTTPIVPVSEDSATLELLLRLVYPILKTHTDIEDPQVMVPALLAATKYEMELPVQMMSEQLAAITPKKPLHVWAAACRTGLESVALSAAKVIKASWSRPASTEALLLMADLGRMEGISAGDYYRLKQFLTGGTVSSLLSPPTGTADPTFTSPSVTFSTEIPGTDLQCFPSSRQGATTPFLVHQSVLSCHSSVLKTRIQELRDSASSVSPSNGTEPLPALYFDVEPEVLSTLLAACYDVDVALPTDLARLAELLVVSQQYLMAHIVQSTRRAWDEVAALRPLEAYFVGLAHGLYDCAQAAAQNVLASPVANAYVAVMEKAPALAYHRLLVYYDSCVQVFRQRLVQASTRIPDHLAATYVCGSDPHKGAHQSSEYNYTTGRGESHCRGNLTIETKVIKTAIKNVSPGVCINPGKSLRNAFHDAVVRAGSGQKTATSVSGFAAALVECIVSGPDEMNQALRDIKIQLD